MNYALCGNEERRMSFNSVISFTVTAINVPVISQFYIINIILTILKSNYGCSM